jgi:hypothetical protein
MAKRPQGLLNVGDSFRTDGGAAFLRSWHLASASRFSLLLGNLLFSNSPLATTTISSLTTISKSPPPHISHFFSNNNVAYSDRSEKLKKKLAIFSKHQQQALWNRNDTHKENIVVLLCKGFHSSTKGLVRKWPWARSVEILRPMPSSEHKPEHPMS